jgi:hypothetical protein
MGENKVDTAIFKEYPQKTDADCGLRIAAYLTGINNDNEDELRQIAGDLHLQESEGVDIVEMEDYFSMRPEYNARANTNWTMEGIKKILEEGKVCVVDYQNWQKPEDRTGSEKDEWGHYGIIYKVADGRVYLYDPGEPETECMKDYSIDEFVDRWYELDFSREDRSVKIPWIRWAMSLDYNAVKAARLDHKTALM